MMLRAALLCLSMTLVGCERPCDRSPAGFCEACYGGRDEMEENWLFCSMTFLWLSSYAIAIAKIRDAFTAPRVQRAPCATETGERLEL